MEKNKQKKTHYHYLPFSEPREGDVVSAENTQIVAQIYSTIHLQLNPV